MTRSAHDPMSRCFQLYYITDRTQIKSSTLDGCIAQAIGVPPRRINEIVLGKRGISADTALRLSRYFGNSAQFWIGLQSGHDLWVASRSKSLNKVRPRQQAA